MAAKRKPQPKAEPVRVPVVHASNRHNGLWALCGKRMFKGDIRVQLTDRANEAAAVTCRDCRGMF